MKKDLLKLFNSHEECFIKFGKTNDHISNKLLSIGKIQLRYNFIYLFSFVYIYTGQILFIKYF